MLREVIITTLACTVLTAGSAAATLQPRLAEPDLLVLTENFKKS